MKNSSHLAFVSVVVLNFNGTKFIEKCVGSLLASDHPNFEVIVVDNASTDGSLECLAAFGERVRIIRNAANLLSAPGLNQGIKAALGEIVVLLDLDAEVRSDWLMRLVEPIEGDSRVAVTGSKLLFGDGRTIQHAGGTIGNNGFTEHGGYGHTDGALDDHLPREVEFVTGASIAIRRSVLDDLGGGLDEMFPFYYEEVDLCWNVRRLGHKVVYVPQSVAIHHESGTMGRGSSRYLFNFHRGRLRFLLKNARLHELLSRIPMGEAWWLAKHGLRGPGRFAVLLAYPAALAALPGAIQRRLHRRRVD